MKSVLVLGAGMVSRPLVRYLLDKTDFNVKIATRTVSKAEKIINNHPRGEALSLNVNNLSELKSLIPDADIVVSLLPYTFHVTVAELCIRHCKDMVTTSYVSDAMRALDEKVRDNGLIILNEIGLDPGIDHMSAMRIIHQVQNNGGKIISFSSYCGALPAPEANTNPFGYKFSWSPKGVLLASKNSARYLKDKKDISISAEKLFENYNIKYVPGVGHFEDYPNRNSLPYIDVYGIHTTETMYRGTLRNVGWCETMKKIADLGLLDEEEKDWRGMTYEDFIRKLINSPEGSDLESELAKYLHIDKYSTVMKRLKWLGLLSNKPLPVQKGSALDILCSVMLEKLRFKGNERDMVVLYHEFIAYYPEEKKKEKITSTLVDYGIPGGDSAIARTVGLPAGIGVKLILQGKINIKGVCIPVIPEIYEPVLQELESLGIICRERTELVDA